MAQGVELIVFPELSLTGYEPSLAQQLAVQADDPRLDIFQTRSNAGRIAIGVGAPTRHAWGVCISTVLFQPGQPRQVLSKKHLHPDELPFFAPGQGALGILCIRPRVALAICYELSVPEHAEEAHRNGATVYLASVAKSESGMENARARLAELAAHYSMTVLMANCIGPCDDFVAAGNSCIANNKGEWIGQLDHSAEGLLIVDLPGHAVSSHPGR